MSRVQRTNQNGVGFMLGGERKIVRRRGRDPQVEAAAIGLATEKIRFHMDVAIAEQDEVESRLGDADILNRMRCLDGPIALCPLLQFSPMAIQKRFGIAAVGRSEFLGDSRQLLLTASLSQ